MALVALHIAAAAWHWWQRDGVMARMRRSFASAELMPDAMRSPSGDGVWRGGRRAGAAVRVCAQQKSGTVSVIDTATRPGRRRDCDRRQAARHRAEPDGRTLYVSDQRSQRAAGGATLRPRKLRGSIALGASPEGIALSPRRPLGGRGHRGDERGRAGRRAPQRGQRRIARSQARTRSTRRSRPTARWLFVSAEDGDAGRRDRRRRAAAGRPASRSAAAARHRLLARRHARLRRLRARQHALRDRHGRACRCRRTIRAGESQQRRRCAPRWRSASTSRTAARASVSVIDSRATQSSPPSRVGQRPVEHGAHARRRQALRGQRPLEQRLGDRHAQALARVADSRRGRSAAGAWRSQPK